MSEQRIVKAVSGEAAIHYHYDGEGRLIAETDAATGETLREYVWLGLPLPWPSPPKIDFQDRFFRVTRTLPAMARQMIIHQLTTVRMRLRRLKQVSLTARRVLKIMPFGLSSYVIGIADIRENYLRGCSLGKILSF